jgi:hypothetical protein
MTGATIENTCCGSKSGESMVGTVAVTMSDLFVEVDLGSDDPDVPKNAIIQTLELVVGATRVSPLGDRDDASAEARNKPATKGFVNSSATNDNMRSKVGPRIVDRVGYE